MEALHGDHGHLRGSGCVLLYDVGEIIQAPPYLAGKERNLFLVNNYGKILKPIYHYLRHYKILESQLPKTRCMDCQRTSETATVVASIKGPWKR